MFDADVFFTEGWIERLVWSYKEYSGKFKIIAGGIHPYLQPREGESIYDYHNVHKYEPHTKFITSHDAISGWSWLLSYETWDKYGTLASNSLGTGQSEDWEYCQRIRNDGFLVGCVQPQIIAHCGLTNSEGNEIVGYEVSKELAKSISPNAILL
jgi:GT2 family glycosyltransferase